MAKKKMCEYWHKKQNLSTLGINGGWCYAGKRKCPKNHNKYCEIVPPKSRVKRIKAWVDVSTRGNPFVFVSGPIAERYPNLMHIYAKELEGLIPCTIMIAEKHLRGEKCGKR